MKKYTRSVKLTPSKITPENIEELIRFMDDALKDQPPPFSRFISGSRGAESISQADGEDDTKVICSLAGMTNVMVSVTPVGKGSTREIIFRLRDSSAEVEVKGEDEVWVTGQIAQIRLVWSKFDPNYNWTRLTVTVLLGVSYFLQSYIHPVTHPLFLMLVRLALPLVPYVTLYYFVRFNWLPYVRITNSVPPRHLGTDSWILIATIIGDVILLIGIVIENMRK